MPRAAVLLAVLFGVVFAAFVGLIVVSDRTTRRLEATTVWTFIGSDGSVAIPGRFEAVTPFRQGLAAVKQDGRWGFIDGTGREVLPFGFEDAGSFSPEGLAPVKENGRWGYLRRDGTWAIPPRYDQADGVAEGRAAVGVVVGLRPGKYPNHRIHSHTFVDLDGREIAPIRPRDDPMRLDSLSSVSQGLAACRIGNDHRYGFVDRDLRVVIPPRFDHAKSFSEGLAAVALGDVWGFVDRAGKFVISPAYRSVEPFREGLAVVGNERYAFLRADGAPAFEATFEWARSFSFGFAAVRAGAGASARWGFIDRTGRLSVEPAYAEVGGGLTHDAGFSEERAAVAVTSGTRDRRWGFVDTAGRLVIPATFLEVDPGGFSEGLCAVRIPR
jgi:hypothetical protein